MTYSIGSRMAGSLVIGTGALVLALSAAAQVPPLINYQGRLVGGTNLVNGSVGLSLRPFDATALGSLV